MYFDDTVPAQECVDYVDAFWAQKPEVGEIDYIQGGLHFYYKTLSKS